MKICYLNPVHDQGGARGGIFEDDEPILEIGAQSNCTPGMLAFAAHRDEVLEYLRICGSPLGQNLFASIANEAGRLDEQLESRRRDRETESESAEIIGRMRESDKPNIGVDFGDNHEGEGVSFGV